MKNLFLILILMFLFLMTGCNQIHYTSITRPRIDNNRDFHYVVADGEQQLEGNNSVRDINKRSRKYDIIIIESDGTYYFTH